MTADSSVAAHDSITVEPGAAIVGLAPTTMTGVLARASGVTPITIEANSVPVLISVTENFVAVVGLGCGSDGPVHAPVGLHDQIKSALLSASFVFVAVRASRVSTSFGPAVHPSCFERFMRYVFSRPK